MSMHRKFVAEAKLQPQDGGVQSHETTCRVLETAACYDQVSLGSLACLELVCRQIQMVQMKYREKLCPVVQKGKQGLPSIEDDIHWYMGTGATRGLVCVSPALLNHIAEKQHVEAMIYKERRKLAEERKLLKSDKE